MDPSYILLSTVFSDPLYKGLDPTELNLSGSQVSGSKSFESLIFFTRKAIPAIAPIRAAAPVSPNIKAEVLLTDSGVTGGGAPHSTASTRVGS